MSHTEYSAEVARIVAKSTGLTLIDTTRAARKRDPHIATQVKAGMFTIVRSVPISGRSNDVTVLAGPMAGYLAVEALQRFAQGGEL